MSVKGILRSPKGELVLLMNERNEWELPGGRIERGESSQVCLSREIREELNLDVQVDHPVDTYLFEVIQGRYVFIATYVCNLIGAFSPSLSHEHKKLGLFAPDALPNNLPDGYRRSIEAICQASER